MNTSTEAPMSMAELLDQDKVWYSRKGRELFRESLDEMDLEHIKRLRAWLLRNADSIQWGILNELERIAARVNGEQAQYDIDRDVADLAGVSPEAWIRNTVLFESLTGRLETVAAEHFTKTNLLTMQRLCKLALSAPPGTHTRNQLRDVEALLHKLSGTGKEAT